MTVKDIINIILKFANEYDRFLIYKESGGGSLKVEHEGTSVKKIDHSHKRVTTFGEIIAQSGYQYHWKIKILEMSNGINIGVIEEDKYMDIVNCNTAFHMVDYEYYAVADK